MQQDHLASVQPFEICSIRPPTENNSLTFRLTRNCYWNKCSFCPIYKTGATFKKRPLEEVTEDIVRAGKLNTLLAENGIGGTMHTRIIHERALNLIKRIQKATHDAGIIGKKRLAPLENSPDPRMRWFSAWFIEFPDITDCVEHLMSWRLSGGRTCFLGDADSLIMEPGYLKEVMGVIRKTFPHIERFTVYGRTRTAAKVRTGEDLSGFKEAGIHRVHFGIESGSAAVLKMVNKGETPEDHVTGSLKVSRAGLSSSFYVMPGLGGMALSEEHATETARVINEASPDYVRLRTLEIFEGTPIDRMRRQGDFVEADDDTVVREIRQMIEQITVPVELLSDSATNLLPIFGHLPEDKKKMLSIVDDYLGRDPRERLEYSLRTRLDAFSGQYGGLSEEVMHAIRPAMSGNNLDLSLTGDDQIKSMTAFVKSRLMP